MPRAFQSFDKPIALVPMSRADIDSFEPKQENIIFFDVDSGRFISWANGGYAPLGDSPRVYTAVVDQGAIPDDPAAPGHFYKTFGVARDHGHVAILIRDMGDAGTVTIAATDDVLAIAGVDTNESELKQNFICNKDDVTFSNLKLTSKTLTLNGKRDIAKDMLISGTGHITATAETCTISGRIIGYTDTTTDTYAIDADANDIGIGPLIVANCTGWAAVRLNGNTDTLGPVYHDEDNVFTNVPYQGGSPPIRPTFRDFTVRGGILKGCIKSPAALLMIHNCSIFGNVDSGSYQVEILNHIAPNAQISGLSMEGLGDLFKYTGATAPLMFEFSDFQFAAGKVWGAVNARWSQLFGYSGTFDADSKAGQAIVGGDLRNPTVSNLPNDIEIRSVAGLDDRGPYGNPDMMPSCRLTRSSDQAILTATVTFFPFNSELWDNDSMHDNSTNPERATAKTPGVYHVSAGIHWPDNTAGVRFLYLYRTRSGGAATIMKLKSYDPDGSDTNPYMTIECLMDLDLNDYARLAVYQDTGVTLTLVAAAEYTPILEVIRVG